MLNFSGDCFGSFFTKFFPTTQNAVIDQPSTPESDHSRRLPARVPSEIRMTNMRHCESALSLSSLESGTATKPIPVRRCHTLPRAASEASFYSSDSSAREAVRLIANHKVWQMYHRITDHRERQPTALPTQQHPAHNLPARPHAFFAEFQPHVQPNDLREQSVHGPRHSQLDQNLIARTSYSALQTIEQDSELRDSNLLESEPFFPLSF
jgi:hypothetical protein